MIRIFAPDTNCDKLKYDKKLLETVLKLKIILISQHRNSALVQQTNRLQAVVDKMNDEEPQVFEKVALMQCSKCQRMIYNDGSQDGGDSFCRHRYAAIGGTLTRSDNAGSHATNEVSVSQFVEPTLREVAAMHQLNHNLRQTEKFKKKLQDDLESKI